MASLNEQESPGPRKCSKRHCPTSPIPGLQLSSLPYDVICAPKGCGSCEYCAVYESLNRSDKESGSGCGGCNQIPPSQFQDGSDSCKRADFFKFFWPKKVCKKVNPGIDSCCAFGSGNGADSGIQYPICSWFASRMYHNLCKRQCCCKTNCWFSNEKKVCKCQNKDSDVLPRRLSTNTLHGVRSVNDLRAWSPCCSEQRRYFFEKMLMDSQTKRDDSDTGSDKPIDHGVDGSTPMQKTYETMLSKKDDELQRMRRQLAELQGKRPSTSTVVFPQESGASKSPTISKTETRETDDGAPVPDEMASPDATDGAEGSEPNQPDKPPSRKSSLASSKSSGSLASVKLEEDPEVDLFEDEPPAGLLEGTSPPPVPKPATTKVGNNLVVAPAESGSGDPCSSMLPEEESCMNLDFDICTNQTVTFIISYN